MLFSSSMVVIKTSKQASKKNEEVLFNQTGKVVIGFSFYRKSREITSHENIPLFVCLVTVYLFIIHTIELIFSLDYGSSIEVI